MKFGWAATKRLDTPTPWPGHINYTSLDGVGSLPNPDAQENCGVSLCDCAASNSGWRMSLGPRLNRRMRLVAASSCELTGFSV